MGRWLVRAGAAASVWAVDRVEAHIVGLAVDRVEERTLWVAELAKDPVEAQSECR